MGLMEREAWTPRREGRWTLADGRGLVAAFEGRPAGETAAAFARRYGLDAQRVHWWRARIREVDGRAAVRFAPVRVVAPGPRSPEAPGAGAAVAPTPPRTPSVEVVTGGRSVRVQAGFDAELLRRVLAALEEGATC